MKYRVDGAHRETGEPMSVIVDAVSESEAEAKANSMGVLVSTVGAESQELTTAETPVDRRREHDLRSSPVYRAAAAPTVQTRPTRSNSLGIASLILAIVALLLCWIPFVAIISLPIAGLAFILAVIAFILALTRSGYGVGYPIAGGFLSVIASIVGMIMGVGLFSATGAVLEGVAESLAEPTQPNPRAASVAPGTAQTEADRPEEPAAQDPLPSRATEGPDWFAADHPVRVGDVEIRFEYARIERPRVVDMFGDVGQGESVQLVVGLTLANRGSTKKIEYTTFRGRGFSLADDRANIEDNFGNRYRMIDYGTGSRPADGVSGSSIYPGESISDVLVFERPVSAATYLYLRLPCGNFGDEGTITLRIDESTIQAPE